MKKQLLMLAVATMSMIGLEAQAQVFSESFNGTGIPSTWSGSNSCNSTSSNAFWEFTTSTPGYGASGFTDNTGTTGSYAMWVDGSSPYPCDVSITTDSIDVSTLTTPSIEFYWAKNNTGSYVGNNVLTVDVFDGQNYYTVWSGQTDSPNWRQVQVDISCLTLNNDIALRFTVSKFAGSASFYNDIIVDDIKVQELPTGYSYCAAPADIAISNVTSSATATVTDGFSCSTSSTTEVIYGLAGFNPYNAGSTASVSSGTATLSNLVSSVTYDVYAVTSCGSGSYSDTLGPISFATPCATVTTPWTENFDAVSTGSSSVPSLPNCWEYYKNGTFGAYHYVYGFNAYSGSNNLRTYKSSSSVYTGDTAMSMTPEIQGLDSATKMVEFYGRKGFSSYPGEVMIGLTNAAGHSSSLRIIDTLYMNSDVYEKYTIYLDGAQSGDARVAFVTIANGVFDYMYIDDIEVLDIPPCPEPISLSLSSATRASATIAWASSSVAFDIEVGPMGFTQGTGTSYTSSTNSVTATGLMQNTYYDVYVRSNCTSSGDGTSSYVGPFTFKTECGWFDEPYSEGFGHATFAGAYNNPMLSDCWDSYVSIVPSWSTAVHTDYSTFYGNTATDTSYLYLGAYASQFSTTNNVGDTALAVLPLVNNLDAGDLQLLFTARGYTGAGSGAQTDNVIIGTMDSTMSLASMTILDTIPTTASYADYTVDLDMAPAGAARVFMMVAAEMNSGYTYGYNEVYVDEVLIRQAPQCPEVYDVVAMALSDSSATMTWGDSSVVDEYVIEYGPAGFVQGTGAPMDTVTGTTWTNNMLMSGTTYDVYVLSVCQAMGVNSPWYGPIQIDIPCSPVASPFADGFENKPTNFGNSANPNLPDCWTYSVNSNPGNSYSYGSTSTWSSYSGSGYLYNRQSNVAGDTVVVSLPMIQDLDQGGKELRFYARVSSTFYQGQMSVATTDAMGHYSSAAVAANMNLDNSTYQQFSVYLDSNVVPQGAQRPAFLFYSISGSFNYIYLDSVEVVDMPSCITYNHTQSNVTSSGADLEWSYTGNDCFNIEYGPTGFIQGTGVGAQAGTLDTNVSAPYTLSGLNPNTTYDYYVENCCNPGTWEGPFTFTTECTGPLATGNYTVGAGGDFATMDSVMSVLNVCGIGGPVTFEFLAGTHTPNGSIGEINGSSAANTITFMGGSGADTITAGGDAAFVLEGAKYMTFEDLYIVGKGFRLNGTSDITIDGNLIEAGVTTSSTVNAIVASSSATSVFSTTVGEKNLTITDNEITGGYYAIRLYGSFSGLNENVEISGNYIHDSYYYGIYVYYGTDVMITDNMMENFGSNFAYGIYPYRIDGLEVSKNHVMDVNYGIWAYYTSSSSNASMTSEISNNMLQANNYALAVYYGDSVGVYHNTAVASYPLRDYYNASNVDIRNNIFQGSTYAVYDYRSDAMQDYNLYHATGSGFAYVYDGSSFNYPDSLAALQALDSLNNMNSVEGDPIFAGPMDLHVFGPLANDAGDNGVGIMEDIDGDVRPSANSTTVDIGADEYDVIGDDAALTALVSPMDGVCGSDSLMISVEIGNFGQNTMTSVTVSADVLGQTLTVTPSVNLAFGEFDTVVVGYVNNLVGGPMSIVAYTTLTNDGRPGNDTLSTSVEVSDAQQVAVMYPDMVCAGDDAMMTVTHPMSGNVLWTVGGDTLAIAGVDSTITLSNITMDTTVNVTMISTNESITTPVPAQTWSGLDGINFTTTEGVILDSVSIYPISGGTEDLEIVDASGATVWTGSATFSAQTGVSEVPVYIGATLGAGSYTLLRASSTTGSWYDQFVGTGTGGFPFYSTDSTIVLTSGTYTSYLEYFFNWKFTVGGCDREDTTFMIGVYPDPVAAITVDTANATITATDWTVNWDASGTMDADSIYVEFSNGTSSNATSGTATYTSNMMGESVTIIAFGPCSSDTLTYSFDVNQISVDEDFMNGTLSIYPNPTRGLFNVEFATEQAKDVEITIVNMVGQIISTDVVEVNGVYNNQFDLSNEAAGVYFIKFTTDDGVLTERITVE